MSDLPSQIVVIAAANHIDLALQRTFEGLAENAKRDFHLDERGWQMAIVYGTTKTAAHAIGAVMGASPAKINELQETMWGSLVKWLYDQAEAAAS